MGLFSGECWFKNLRFSRSGHQSGFLRAAPCEVVTAPCPTGPCATGHFISSDIHHLENTLLANHPKPSGNWRKRQSHSDRTVPPEILWITSSSCLIARSSIAENWQPIAQRSKREVSSTPLATINEQPTTVFSSAAPAEPCRSAHPAVSSRQTRLRWYARSRSPSRPASSTAARSGRPPRRENRATLSPGLSPAPDRKSTR